MREASAGTLLTGVSLATVLATAPVPSYASDASNPTRQPAEAEAVSEMRDPSFTTHYGVPEPPESLTSGLPDIEWQHALLAAIALASGAGVAAFVIIRNGNKDD